MVQIGGFELDTCYVASPASQPDIARATALGDSDTWSLAPGAESVKLLAAWFEPCPIRGSRHSWQRVGVVLRLAR